MMCSTPSSRNFQVVSRSALGAGMGGDEPEAALLAAEDIVVEVMKAEEEDCGQGVSHQVAVKSRVQASTRASLIM